RATAGRSLGMAADAIGALRDVSCGYSYQLLGLRGQCPVGKNQVTEVRERIVDFRRKLLAAGTKAGSGLGKNFSRHDGSPRFVVAYRLAGRRIRSGQSSWRQTCPSSAPQRFSRPRKVPELQLRLSFTSCKR